MDGGRDEASGEGIDRGREVAREQERAISREVFLRWALASIQYIHKPSHNAALAIDSLLLQMKNIEQVPLVYIINSVYCLSGG